MSPAVESASRASVSGDPTGLGVETRLGRFAAGGRRWSRRSDSRTRRTVTGHQTAPQVVGNPLFSEPLRYPLEGVPAGSHGLGGGFGHSSHGVGEKPAWERYWPSISGNSKVKPPDTQAIRVACSSVNPVGYLW